MSRLFYGDEDEALRAVVEEGRGYKETAAYLWPSLKPESAYARLKACVNPDKPEKLSFGEVIAAMNFNQRFDALFYACDETSHDRPIARAPEDAKAEFQRAFMKSVDEQRQIVERMERLAKVAR